MMTIRRVALASLMFLILPASFSVLRGQRSSAVASAQRQKRVVRQTPQTGRIEISTTPAGYPISIDDRPVGETTEYPRTLDLEPGTHTIEIQFPDNGRWRQTFSVLSGKKICISLTYQPKSPGAASPETTTPPPSLPPGDSKVGDISQALAFRQGDISGTIADCGETAMPSDDSAPAIVKPRIPTTRSFPQTTSPPSLEAPPAKPELPELGDETKNEDYTIVPIFYGTDRARTGAPEPKEFYGAGRGQLELGTCEVSIPKTHQRGQLESPSIWRLEFKEDPKLHVVLLSVKPLAASEFNSQFQTRLGAATSRDVFVFIHGYNVKFVDAARRTAQLAYDLEFPGVPVLYSWPSQGTLLGYFADEEAVRLTEPHLKQFLTDLVAQAGGARIHLVAHSMGNRALTGVLQLLAANATQPIFSEVILTAPDIDARELPKLAPDLQKVARHITLYASSTDAALMASKEAHGGKYHRAGDSLPEIVVVPGIDAIDATGIDTNLLGHTYFAQMKVVMDDINLLMIASKSPAERLLLQQVRGAGTYWTLPGVVVRPNSTPWWRYLTIRNLLIFAVLFTAFVAVAVWRVLHARRRRRAAAVA